MTSNIHQVQWEPVNYNHISSAASIAFKFNESLPCAFNFNLVHTKNANLNLSIINPKDAIEYNYVFPANLKNFKNVEIPGQNTFYVDNLINTSFCQKKHLITTIPRLLNNQKIEIFYYKSYFLYFLCVFVGWLYFFAWSISFYPQIFLNYKRKSTTGLNLDFVLLNIFGFLAYSVYNLGFYFDRDLLASYFQKYPDKLEPVQLNDVVFSIHALTFSIITFLQILYYNKEGIYMLIKKLSVISYSFTCFLIIILIFLVLNDSSSLNIIQQISYVKIVVTLIKYIPQACLNYRRKSTVGFSISQILLDLTGGILSLLQSILENYNFNIWSVNNPVKYCLGIFSLIFDLIFISQHYYFYRNNRDGYMHRNNNNTPRNRRNNRNSRPEHSYSYERGIYIPPSSYSNSISELDTDESQILV